MGGAAVARLFAPPSWSLGTACGCALAVGVLLAGCQASPQTPESPGAEPTPTIRHVMVSRITVYRSIEQLARDSDAVVRVRVDGPSETVPADSQGIDALESTLTPVTILEVLQGSVGDAQLVVRQTGSDTMVVDGNAELLRAGSEYVLFLDAFTFDSSGPGTGEWIPTGEVGVYRLDAGRYLRVADDAPELPTTVTLADVRA